MRWPWQPKEAVLFDSEFDIEGVHVFAIDRADGETRISYYDKRGDSQECFLLTHAAVHTNYVDRYRKKLYLDRQLVDILTPITKVTVDISDEEK